MQAHEKLPNTVGLAIVNLHDDDTDMLVAAVGLHFGDMPVAREEEEEVLLIVLV